MKTKLLPSIEQRWDELLDINNILGYEIIDKYSQFHNFLKQAPEKYMFVPCRKELIIYPANFTQEYRPTHRYIPLEKPDFFDGSYDDNGYGDVDKYQYHLDCKQYQKALDRVIFDGLEYYDNHGGYDRVHNEEITIEFQPDGSIYLDIHSTYIKEIKSLADLSGKAYLNSNGQKQAGI